MTRRTSSLVGLAIAVGVLLFPLIALAQDAGAGAGDENLSSGWQLGLTLYEILIPILVAGLMWLKVRIIGWIKAKTKNETLAGILSRLNESVFEAVKMVNEQMKDLIGKAKDPASPGGTQITLEEAAKLRKAALDYVKAYWGEKGLKELAHVLGFGGVLGMGTDEKGLERLIANKIEAAVHDVKAEARNPG